MSIDDDIRSAFADHDDEMEGRAASWPAIERGIRTRRRRAAVVAPVAVVALALVIAGAWNALDDGADVGGFVGPGEDGDVGFLLLRDDGALELRDATGKLEREVLPADESVGFRYKLSASRATGMAYFAVLNDPEDCGDRMFSVEIATGELREIGRGRAPAISPDGRWLAYGSFTTEDGRCTSQGLTIADVDRESRLLWQTRIWDTFSTPVIRPIPSLISWAPDSRHIGYVIHGEDVPPTVFLGDRTEAGDLFSHEQMGLGDLEASVRLLAIIDGSRGRVVLEDERGAGPLNARRFMTYEITTHGSSQPMSLHTMMPTGMDIDRTGTFVLQAWDTDSRGLVGYSRIDERDSAAKVLTRDAFGEVVWYD
jgi:hypothetical protein